MTDPRRGLPTSLLRALRAVERADSDPGRAALFERVRRRSPAIGAAVSAHALLGATPASSALIGGYALAEAARITPPARPRPVLGLGVYPTDRPALEYVAGCVGHQHLAWLEAARPGPAAVVALARAVARGGVKRRAARLVHRLNRRHGFLVACRLAATIVWYLRARALLAEGAVRAVLVTSDYHPESRGLAGAARAAGIPSIFVTHAHPHRLCPALDFDLSILEGAAALRAYEAKGPVRGEVIFRGIDGESSPLDASRLLVTHPVIGLFLPKELRWEVLEQLVLEARRRFAPRRFLVRWHPNMLDARRLTAALSEAGDVEVTPGSAPLAEVARRCDWVLAEESSNVHLGTLKVGVPSVPVAGLAVTEGASDYYGFIAARVLPPTCASLRDLSLEACAAFFSDAGWTARFRDYDASYLLERGALDREVGRRVLALTTPAPSDGRRA